MEKFKPQVRILESSTKISVSDEWFRSFFYEPTMDPVANLTMMKKKVTMDYNGMATWF